MKDATEILIRYRLERARESLQEAKILLENSKLYAAVNRIYYAMFYSVNALLLSKNISSSKHSGVRALFNKEFVNKGLIDKDLGRFYSKMFERRQRGDYEDLVEFKREDVEEWLNKAEEFVTRIEEITLKMIEVKDEERI